MKIELLHLNLAESAVCWTLHKFVQEGVLLNNVSKSKQQLFHFWSFSLTFRSTNIFHIRMSKKEILYISFSIYLFLTLWVNFLWLKLNSLNLVESREKWVESREKCLWQYSALYILSFWTFFPLFVVKRKCFIWSFTVQSQTEIF